MQGIGVLVILGFLSVCDGFSPVLPSVSFPGMQSITKSFPTFLRSNSKGPQFDLKWSDTDDLLFEGAKVTKVSDKPPAYVVFGNDSESGIERFGVRIHKQVFSLFAGVCVNPRVPSRPCWADVLRTPAVMVEKGGSVFRTGRLGSKMVEYLGRDLKKLMPNDSYPPKYNVGDTLFMELDKDKQELKIWVNENDSFVINDIEKSSKFFVNLEGQDSSVEVVDVPL